LFRTNQTRAGCNRPLSQDRSASGRAHTVFQHAVAKQSMAIAVQCPAAQAMRDRNNPDGRGENSPMGEHLEGRYANYFEIGFRAQEFLLDFGQFDEDSGSAIRHTRIITNPVSAKTFLKMLTEVMKEYETSVGWIGSEPGGDA
ncbi:MAG TPA: DUF3467 domain-containing protein, partial [Bryobacteraceae bacterium]